MSSPIRRLVDLISEAVDILESRCSKNRTPVPVLEDPFHPLSEEFRQDAVASDAANVITAAAMQLSAIVTAPHITLYQCAGGHFRAAATRVCLESNVTEIIREADSKGVHVEDICAKNGQDPGKLVRFLRFLATHHIYREVAPDVFANTRLSSMIDTLKSSSDILDNPQHKHDGTFGFAALPSFHLDETFKAAAWCWETLEDPKTRLSGETTDSPFNVAFNTKKSIWEFYDQSEERFRQRRFDIAMKGMRAMQPIDAILSAFDWKSLPRGALVVDVGGGIGTSVMCLAQNFPSLRFVVQDLSHTVDNAQEILSKEMPEAFNSGIIGLEVHDFFDEQPRKDAEVFLLKSVCHDWSDEYCAEILTRLREAAKPSATLLIIDSLMPLACRNPDQGQGLNIPGASIAEAPEPLLANFGMANDMCYNSDIGMFLMLNSQERTLHHFQRLFTKCGWRLMRINRTKGDNTFNQAMEATPI